MPDSRALPFVPAVPGQRLLARSAGQI